MLLTYDWKQQFSSNCEFRQCREEPMLDYPDHGLREEAGPSHARCGYGPLLLPKQPRLFRRCGNRQCKKKHSRAGTFKCTHCFRAYFCSIECRDSTSSKHDCLDNRKGKMCNLRACTSVGEAKYDTKLCSHCNYHRYCSKACLKRVGTITTTGHGA